MRKKRIKTVSISLGQSSMVHLGEVGPAIWDTTLDEIEATLLKDDPDAHFSRKDFTPDWRKLAHRRKFNREVFEKYGYFKDIILHPKFQAFKHYCEENVNLFDLTVGEPLMPFYNCIILLFMLNKRVNMYIMVLIGCFLMNLNPIHVTIVALAYFMMQKTKKPKHFKTIKKSPVDCNVYQPRELEDCGSFSESYDHILLGGDMATLYTAALLSACGHKCCVLQPKYSSPLIVHPEDAPCEAPLVQCVASKVERYQVCHTKTSRSYQNYKKMTLKLNILICS